MLTASPLPQLEHGKRRSRKERGTKDGGNDTEQSPLLHPENSVHGGLLRKVETLLQAGAVSDGVISGCTAPPCGPLPR